MAGENYIGSKISLISLSDIRYVGILHSINAQDSTVGLKQVRSFGTEGRRGNPEEEILPSDNVFDYVVFRGSDIKDLQVFEAPPKPAPSALPQDPAIMSMGSYPPPSNNNYGYMQQPAANYYQPPPQETQKQEQLEKETLDNLKSELEEADNTLDDDAVDQLAKRVSELNPNAQEEQEETKVVVEEQRRPRYGRGGRQYQQQRSYNKNLVIPKSEFDFEASNAKFDKSEITAEEEEDKVESPEAEEFYDKKSSFFDNISCESKERSEQQNEPRRSRFHEERKLNMETFGQSTVDQSRYRNNNYRGRGRGNYRGGYYRYNNNNNGGYNNNRQQQQD